MTENMKLGSTATSWLIGQDSTAKGRMPLFRTNSDSATALTLTVFAKFPKRWL